MERISTLLDKIKELNSRPNPSVIEVDLMMDYIRVVYADLVEWRNKLAFNDAMTIKPATPAQPLVQQAPPQTPPVAEQPEIAGPAVELDVTSFNYAATEPTVSFSELLQKDKHYSGADIRQMIGINDKYQYISELFGNNKDAYEEVISEINTFDTEEEAIAWVNNSVANQFDWRDEMESVQSFFKLLSDFFASR